jgi:aminoglycoside 6'-N-acetyltransferase I
LTFLHCLTGVGVKVGLVAMNLSDAVGKYEASACDARVEFGRSADTVNVTIRTIVETDRADWARLRDALWPGSFAAQETETRNYFASGAATPVVFVAEDEGKIVGFLELDFRRYAAGCNSSPVPFIEGWYVEPGVRQQGIGRALVAAAEGHARAEGYHEMASDTELENDGSIAAHKACGFLAIERVVCFRKSLRDA